jgi:hypothetical protein
MYLAHIDNQGNYVVEKLEFSMDLYNIGGRDSKLHPNFFEFEPRNSFPGSEQMKRFLGESVESIVEDFSRKLEEPAKLAREVQKGLRPGKNELYIFNVPNKEFPLGEVFNYGEHGGFNRILTRGVISKPVSLAIERGFRGSSSRRMEASEYTSEVQGKNPLPREEFLELGRGMVKVLLDFYDEVNEPFSKNIEELENNERFERLRQVPKGVNIEKFLPHSSSNYIY